MKLRNYLLMFVVIGLMIPAVSISANHVSAAGTYDYKVSSSSVLNSQGTTVYTGASFTAALGWAVYHANTKTWVPAGSYTLTGNVLFATGTTLFGDGDTTSFTATSAAAFYIPNSGVSLANFKTTGHVYVIAYADTSVTLNTLSLTNIHAVDTSVDLEAAFELYTGNSATINGVTFSGCSVTNSGCYGFVLVGSGHTNGNLIENVAFTNCQAIDCGRNSQDNDWVVGFDLAELTNVQNLILTGCTATGCWESGFHMEIDCSVVNAQFINCIASNNGQKPVPTFGMGFFFDWQRIPNVTLTNCSGTGNKVCLSSFDTPSLSGYSNPTTVNMKTWENPSTGYASSGKWYPAGAPDAKSDLVFVATATGQTLSNANCNVDTGYKTINLFPSYTGSVTKVAQQAVKHWAPTFTNSPSTTGTIGSAYSYTPSVNESSTLALVTKPTWASWSGSVMSGTPAAAGSYPSRSRPPQTQVPCRAGRTGQSSSRPLPPSSVLNGLRRSPTAQARQGRWDRSTRTPQRSTRPRPYPW